MRSTAITRRSRSRLQPAAPAAGIAFLAFSAAGQEYALPLLAVRELVGVGNLEAALGAPAALCGFASLRTGERVVVVDLAVVLGGTSAAERLESCVLVPTADASGRTVGFLVDNVSRTIGVAADEVVPASRIGGFVEASSIAAMIPVEAGFVPVLDFDRLLASSEVRAVASLTSAAFSSAVERPRDGSAR